MFYVHKKYSLSEWSHQITSNQKILISLQTTIGTIHLHNVYNWDARLTVEELLEGIKEPGEHVLVGDFNLHHRWWGGPLVLQEDLRARELREACQDTLYLATLPGLIT